MNRRGQIYILGLLAVFFAVVALISSLPSMYLDTGASSQADLIYLSLNESFKGCLAYAREKAWKKFQSEVPENPSEFKDETPRHLNECLKEMAKYVERYYGAPVTVNPLQYSSSIEEVNASANFEVKSGWLSKELKIRCSRSLKLYIKSTRVVGSPPLSYLEVNFTFQVNGAMPPYVYIEIYFKERLEKTYTYRKVMEGIVSQYNGEFTIFIYLEPKYYVEESGNMVYKEVEFVLKACDRTGACVWATGKQELNV